MAILENKSGYASIVETPEEQAMSDVELKSHCAQWLKSLCGKVFINRSTGISINVNRDIKNEMMSKIHVNRKRSRLVTRAKLMAIKIMPYLLRYSVPDVLNEPDKNGRTGVTSNNFKYVCLINKIPY